MERRTYVHHVAGRISSLRDFLDIGCGSGELVFELAKKGVNAWGIDFAPRMIELCEEQNAQQRYENCHFVKGSIFDDKEWTTHFDLISALGFIEYVSPNELESLLELIRNLLRLDGSLVISSRNRLLNIYSSNDFTIEEMSAGTLETIVGESIAIVSAESLDVCIDDLRKLQTPARQIARFPERAGIEVETRFQYTPAQLVQLIERHGFHVVALSPVNYHGLPPSLKDAWPDAHTAIKRTVMPRLTECHHAIPYGSVFMVHAVRSDRNE